MIDTLAYVKRLEGAGISRTQAEAHALAMNETVVPQLATKADIESLRAAIEGAKVTIILALIGVAGVALATAKAIF